MAKRPDRNRRCPVCAVKFTPRTETCPKCGHKPLDMPKFVGQRKPLKGGGKLKLKQ